MFTSLKSFDFMVAISDCDNHSDAIQQLSNWSIDWMQFKIHCCANPAVVFDVDGTLVHKDGNGEHARIDAMFEVYKFCVSNNIKCYVVTARVDCKEGKKELLRLLKEHKFKKLRIST